MKAISALFIAGSLIVLLSGCTAYKHNKAGDAAAQTGDMRSAVYHYEQALAHKDNYARNANFLTKLAAARSNVAYSEAQQLRTEGRYEAALDQLHESMRQDPNHTEPKALLPMVLKEAAHWRYTKALAAADAGDLETAREHLARSMQHDLSDESVADAMTSLTPESLDASTPGLADYQRAVTQSADRRWKLAEQTLLQSVGTNGDLLPARAALHEARARLAEARRLQSEGQLRIDQHTMGPAIKSLNRSLDIWPHNTQGHDLLSKAKTQQTHADEQFTKATALADQTKWDDAITRANSGWKIDRSHTGLNDLRHSLPRQAAADHTRRGDAHMGSGELNKAHQSYSHALRYRRTDRAARTGLASVYAAWGKDHEQAGQLGAAFLNYVKGQSYSQSKSLDKDAKRMRAAIHGRLGVGLFVSANDQARGEIDPRQLTAATLGTLQSERSHGLIIQGQAAPYELRLSIRKADIDERRTKTARRTHHYTTQERRHNPQYDRIASQLRREQAALSRYKSQVSSFRSKGRRDDGWSKSVNGSHHNHLQNQVHRQRRTVDRLRHQLACTPRQISVTRHHRWDYTVETYTKTGELQVTTQLIDTTTSKPIKTFIHQTSFTQNDDRTRNANPHVGLNHDGLNLRSDGFVSRSLTHELAESAGPWAVNALVDHRLAQINASIDVFEEAGKTAKTLEARVQAAVLLAIVDPKSSQQALDKLTQSHAR